MRSVLVAILAWFTLSATADAQGDPRFALVIGNQAYSGALTKLNRPHQDAERIGTALGTAGFSVTQRNDQGRGEILTEVRALADQLRQAGPNAVGFFYYSGHGASALVGSRRQNFLIPTGAEITDASELVSDGVPLDTIVSLLEQTGAKAVFIVFDACRSELPWSKGGAADPDKAFNTVAARPGLFIAFSTDAGATSPDDGVFSTALAEQLVQPNVPHVLAFDEAALVVGRTRGTDRLPWYSNQVRDRFYFVTVASTPSGAAQPIAVVSEPVPVVPPATILDARTTPATTRVPVTVVDPQTLPDFALFRECEGCPEMVVLPANTFAMGSTDGERGAQPPRQVSIRRFAISRFETTWNEWDVCVAAGACNGKGPETGARSLDVTKGQDWGWGKGQRPAIFVDWSDARSFAGFATGRTGAVYRLPSEAEWEYAARAGSADSYAWGAVDPVCDTLAFTGANFDACTDERTREVGSFRANRYGLFDLHGNVWEWVEDCHENSYSAPVGTAFATDACVDRLYRGGSWSSDPAYLRSASRIWFQPSYRANTLGFRLARAL